MCGIVGITGRHPDLIRSMSAALAHRGPDGSGVWMNSSVSLAHRRLAVLDLSERARQPMEYGGLVMVYNGEVYNFREIRAKLETCGDVFESNSDTEVLLHAYAAWGPDFLKRLNGMFALAIYDVAKREIFLARDRLGIKPLYWTRQGGQWAFASEIKALLPALKSLELDTGALVDYLTYRFVPDEKTLFKDIQKLPPGHYMRIDLAKGDVEARPYWTIRFGNNGQPLDQNAERVRELLRASVRRQLVSDVPLGAYLSGGLDSSAIVALMAEVSDRPVNTYTVTFGESALSEARYARLVADGFSTRHQEIHVDMDAVGVLPEVVRHLEEPIGDAATIPTYLMARETKKHVTVVLSGEGSDEIFAGYDKYKYLHFSRLFPSLPKMLSRAGRLGCLFDRNGARKYRRFAAVFDDPEMARLLTFPVEEARRFQLEPLFSTGHPLHDLLNLDIATWLPNDLLLKGDKMTMAHAVEARVPFLDHELVEFAATIPPEQKLAWGREKLVYRRAIEPLLPREITRRKKQGFTIPLREWLRAGLRDYALDVLRSTDIPQLNKAALESVVRNASGGVFARRRFWTILFLAVWFAQFRAGLRRED